MAVAAPVLPFAAMALSAAGTLYQGYEENKAARAEARQDEENGRLSIKAGEEEAYDVLRQGYFETGQAASALAGSGLAWGGSIADVLADSTRQAELDIERVRAGARGEAANHYAQARQNRKAGKAALVGSVFSALAQTVGGVAEHRRQVRLDRQAGVERGVRLGGSTLAASRRYGQRGYY